MTWQVVPAIWLAVAGWIGLEVWRAWGSYRRLQRTLLLILDSGPRSALELSAVLGGRTYSALAALEDRGVVRRYEDRSPTTLALRGGRPRSYYELV